MMLLFCSHAVLDGMLMFRIPLPVAPAFAALGRGVWGAYEVAVNERNVNPDTVKFNDSLILGRQIIHILPEGSAVLNPEKMAYCLDGARTEIRLPIRINATSPIAMDLQRTDLDSGANETIHISKSQIKAMHKDAARLLTYSDKEFEPKTLYYSIKKPGLYLLAKVVDESNLEVARRQLAHTVVVPCPRAEVKPSNPNQCKGELSNIAIEVTGTPPLTLKYRKKIADRTAQDATLDNVLPDDFHSPLGRQDQGALIIPNRIETSWAKGQSIIVPLAENLGTAGTWSYSISEVRDAFGNAVVYSHRDHEGQGRKSARSSSALHQAITVHERPSVALQGCTPQNALKVAKGQNTRLPIRLGSTAKGELNETYEVQYLYTPEEQLSTTGEHPPDSKPSVWSDVSGTSLPSIVEAGLYTITGVSTKFCQGEVMEPASCILQIPPQPRVSLESEGIFDKCAGSPIGLRVSLDLAGTPPFEVHYQMIRVGSNRPLPQMTRIQGLRGQVELLPQEAGQYRYDFLSISDSIYKEIKLNKMSLNQTVKPSASAHFLDAREPRAICIDDTAAFDVALSGEPPFRLEYELVHNGRRMKKSLENLEDNHVRVETPPLTSGGDHTIALMSITDRMGCKEFLNREAKINVRPQRPRVGFKALDGGARSLSALEGGKVALPLRLEGEGPWTVAFRDPAGGEHREKLQQNDRIMGNKEGVYELLSVSDRTCPGSVDASANEFEVKWIPRPELRVLGEELKRTGQVITKPDICEGDDDAIDFMFKGSPPFQADYRLHITPVKGTISPKDRELRAATHSASLRMDTKLPGVYEYKFHKLKDNNYDHSPSHKKNLVPLTVQQRVHSRPSAAFATPDKTYRFCSSDSATGEEVIPISVHGLAPFDVEVEIKHHGSARPETLALTGITSTSHNIRIPHSRLSRGRSSVSLRRVSDARGCVRILDSMTPGVLISVHDAPTIVPLEPQTDFCVGERINFALSGVAPFTISYSFNDVTRKATEKSDNKFSRLAEKPGTFVVRGVKDGASSCKASAEIRKVIHGLPSVRVSKGRESYVDIHEGGEVEILFEFGGTPPFEFTYTRSENSDRNGKPGKVLDMRSERSEGHSLRIMESQEGTYEVVSVRDAFCSYAKPGVKVDGGREGRKLLL